MRAVLKQAALIGLPAAMLSSCGPCPPDEYLFLLRDPDEGTRALLDSCSGGNQQDCQTLCGLLVRRNTGYDRGWAAHCEVHPPKDGYVQVHVGYDGDCPGGRRPAGFRSRAAHSGCQVGAWLSRMAQLEAASVPAFHRLARDLRRFGAPSSLVRRARKAAGDEIRHARAVEALARSHGADVPRPTIARASRRALVDVLLENAVEGCVHETFGAAVAHHQAATAQDRRIRRLMAVIAEDETRHAELAWDVHRWGASQLNDTDAGQLGEAIRASARARAGGTHDGQPDHVRTVLGLPDQTASRAMVAYLVERLWV